MSQVSDENIINSGPLSSQKMDRPTRKRSVGASYSDDGNGSDCDNDIDGDYERKQNKNKKGTRKSQQSFNDESADVECDDDDIDESSCNEAGHIRKITVQDFMCHRKLTIAFGKNVTFVTGQNGSGKSAIAAAIQLVLGASTRNTGRGNSLSSLVREGSDGPAILTLYLVNTGVDAYRNDLYGDVIKIERKIPKSGSGGYKMYGKKDVYKKIISDKKEELEKIIQNFNVHVDNPCIVLTQEQSKLFIQGSPKDKYTFFLKATSLDKIHEELKTCKNQLEHSQNDLTKALTGIQKKHDDYNKKKSDLDDFKSLQKFQDNINMCKAKQFWFDAYVIQDTNNILLEKNRENQVALQKAKEEADELKKKADQSDNEETIYHQLEDITHRKVTVRNELDEKMNELNKKQKETNNLSKNLTTLEKSKVDLEKRAKSIRAEIVAKQKLAKDAAVGDEKVIVEKKGDVDLKISQCKEKIELLSRKKENAQREIEECNRKSRDTDFERQRIEKRLGDLTRNKISLEASSSSSSSNRCLKFGTKVPQILKEIESENFKDKPIGPMGLFVSLPDQFKEWGLAVERILGSQKGFIVTCLADQKKLSNILRKVGAERDHMVHIVPVRERYAPQQPDCLTVLNVISVSNDQVFNVILDTFGAEKAALFKNENEFTSLLKNKTAFKDGIGKALQPNGLQISFSGGGARNDEEYRSLRTGVFSSDSDSREILNSMSDDIKKVEKELDDFRRITSTNITLQAMTQNREIIRNAESEYKIIQTSIRTLEKEKKDLDEELGEIQQNRKIDTSALEDEEKEILEGIDQSKIYEDELKAQYHIFENELRQCTSAKKDAEKRLKELDSELDQIEKNIEGVLYKKKDLESKIRGANQTVQKYDKVVTELQIEIDSQNEEMSQKFKEAEDWTRVNIFEWNGKPIECTENDTKKNLEQRIISLSKKYDAEKKKHGLEGNTLEILTDRVQRAKKDLDESEAERSKIEINVNNLERDLEVRLQKWSQSLNINSKTVGRQFDKYLNLKGLSGKAKFDHIANILDFTLQTDNHDINTRTSDVTTLSGGERSFVTFTLLLALGHVIESPFRIMDEYDVFFDEVARQKSLEMIIEYAKKPEQRHRQMIIITPHTLKNITTNDFVGIFKMPNPARSTHGLQQTTID